MTEICENETAVNPARNLSIGATWPRGALRAAKNWTERKSSNHQQLLTDILLDFRLTCYMYMGAS